MIMDMARGSSQSCQSRRDFMVEPMVPSSFDKRKYSESECADIIREIARVGRSDATKAVPERSNFRDEIHFTPTDTIMIILLCSSALDGPAMLMWWLLQTTS
jgi:hypothetical protein